MACSKHPNQTEKERHHEICIQAGTSKSILNVIGIIRNFQQDRLKEAEPEEILLALIK